MAKTTSNTSATGKTNPLGQQIGVVKIVSGTVTATGADGVARILKVGDAVYLDDVIKTADLSFIQIALNTGAHFELGRSSEAVLDNSVLQGPLLAQGDTGQAPDVEAIQAAIQAGQDPTQITPPPAAGPGAGGPGGDDGHSFVVVNFEDQQGLVNSGFDTTGLGFAAAGTLEETAPLIIPPPGISINDVTVNEGAGTATFTVTLDAPSANTVTVNFTTANGSATAGSDYTAGNGIVSFAPGVTSQTITVPITDDNVFEGTENFFVNLSAPVNGDIVDAQGVGTIIDNEAQPGLSINDVTVNESAGTATFTVTLSGPSAGPVTVDFATANGTATSGLDYTGQTGSLSFAPGVVSQTITVPILNDTIVESAETYTVNLTNASGASIVDNQGLGTIIDNDTALPPPPPPPGPGLPTLSINDVTVGEGSTATFTVTLSSPSTVPVTVNFTTSDGTAAAGLDYAANSGTLTFAPGVTSQTVNVSALLDGIFEGNETFTVNLSAPTNATIADGAGLGTIIDGESAPSLSIDDVTVTEGGLATFTLTLSGATANPITVDVATSNGTALTGSDYIGNTITLIFTPGTTTQTFSIQTLQDSISEGDETFNLNLSNITGGATIADNLGLGTIADDEGLPTLSVNDQSVIEGGTATFTVTLSNPSSQTVTVNFSTADGTAISGGAGVGENDYGSTSGTLTFLPGETTKTVDVTTNDDAVVEGTENFTLDLNTPANAVISDAIGVGTIADNEGAPSIIINDVTVNESAGTATFTVTLSNTSASTVTVDFATADGTATNGADYIGQTGTLTFVAGDTSESITVPVLNDTVYEGNETFVVNLTNPTNATIADPQGLGTITDDDAVPTASVAVAPASVSEDGVTSLLVYTVTLDHASAFATTVNFTLTGTATQGTDYTPSITGSVVIAAGDTTGTITVDPTADNIFEDNETVTVTLTGGTTNGQAIGIGVAAATGTITNDDTQPTISINDVTVNESAGTATFTVTLSGPSANTVMVDFATADGTAKDGVGVGETGPGIPDYTGQAGTLTFNSGDPLTQTITVAINPDTVYEGNETFFVNLTNPTNATIADPQGLGTITDDDAVPTASVAVAPASVPEDGVTSLLVYTVTLDHASAFATTVNFTLTGTATQGTDYTPSITGFVVIAAGDTTGTITVDPTADNIFEDNETVTVTLTGGTTNGQAIGIGTAAATGTITNDDPLPAISINDITVNEGAGTATFTVSLSNPSSQTVMVQYQTDNGTATVGADYTGQTGTVTFAPGVVSQPITVAILEDTLAENAETFFVNLLTPTNATIADTQGVGTIIDNDSSNLTIDDVTVNEAAGTATFTVSLSNPSAGPVTVDFATANGSATAGLDYTGQTDTLTFVAGDTSESITVPILNDTIYEGDETFTVNLSNATGGAIIADNQGIGTITDNDAPPTASVAVSPALVEEDGATNLVYTVTLDRTSAFATTVNFTLTGTATQGTDYTPSLTGSITIPAGGTSGTITVDPTADLAVEPDETVTVTLTGGTTNGQAIGIGGLPATGTILNDDPKISISDFIQSEGTPAPGNESLSTLFTFTVTLSAPSTQTVTVNYATDDGTALTTGPANSPFFDYTPQSGQVIFTPDPTTGLTPTTQTITIQVRPDSFTESPETFSVNLTNPTYATILDGQGVGTILNDDSINISDATVNEAAGTATFTVSLSNALPHPVTVDFATADGTATAGSDYLAQTGTLTFASGVTSQTITIPILNDAIFEGNETFTVSLSNASGDTIKDGIGVGTITDDDLPPTLNISDLLTGAGPHGGDLGEFLRFDTQTSPGNTLVTLDTDGAGPALNVPLVTLTGMVVHDLSALLSPTPDYTP